eukprot:m.25695 g.25695  ORF g.25695 m.25695 type:complete len:50 (+) comp8750_c0_seq1:319-468(+)
MLPVLIRSLPHLNALASVWFGVLHVFMYVDACALRHCTFAVIPAGYPLL